MMMHPYRWRKIIAVLVEPTFVALGHAIVHAASEACHWSPTSIIPIPFPKTISLFLHATFDALAHFYLGHFFQTSAREAC